jgi:hypothetical protein
MDIAWGVVTRRLRMASRTSSDTCGRPLIRRLWRHLCRGVHLVDVANRKATARSLGYDWNRNHARRQPSFLEERGLPEKKCLKLQLL